MARIRNSSIKKLKPRTKVEFCALFILNLTLNQHCVHSCIQNWQKMVTLHRKDIFLLTCFTCFYLLCFYTAIFLAEKALNFCYITVIHTSVTNCLPVVLKSPKFLFFYRIWLELLAYFWQSFNPAFRLQLR